MLASISSLQKNKWITSRNAATLWPTATETCIPLSIPQLRRGA
uniref:Uncharacterized protein n=1 Tax=Zea mays TaxID=4577 RepID=C4J2X2_MAIZE|nr:unknown [Zea mays]